MMTKEQALQFARASVLSAEDMVKEYASQVSAVGAYYDNVTDTLNDEKASAYLDDASVEFCTALFNRDPALYALAVSDGQIPDSATRAVSATGIKRVRTNDGMQTVITFSDGRRIRIQRLNAIESMGLSGWHVVQTEGFDGGDCTHVGDTQAEAVRTLTERLNAVATPARVVAVEGLEDKGVFDVLLSDGLEETRVIALGFDSIDAGLTAQRKLLHRTGRCWLSIRATLKGAARVDASSLIARRNPNVTLGNLQVLADTINATFSGKEQARVANAIRSGKPLIADVQRLREACQGVAPWTREAGICRSILDTLDNYGLTTQVGNDGTPGYVAMGR